MGKLCKSYNLWEIEPDFKAWESDTRALGIELKLYYLSINVLIKRKRNYMIKCLFLSFFYISATFPAPSHITMYNADLLILFSLHWYVYFVSQLSHMLDPLPGAFSLVQFPWMIPHLLWSNNFNGTCSVTLFIMHSTWLRQLSACLQCRVFHPWVRKPWRRKWHPTPVLLPRKSHGRRSLEGYSPWGCKESDMTEQLHFLTTFIWCPILFTQL